MHPMILAVSTAIPECVFQQDDIAKKSLEILPISNEKVETLSRIYRNSSIQKRHSVVDDFHKPREQWEFWGKEFPKKVPGMTERNLRYKKDAPLLAEKAAKEAIDKWGGDKSLITHVVSISCTGVIAPGIEYYLMQNLGLSPAINRLGVNFMGCFGAFKGLSVAQAFAQANPEARILVVCTELCSLYMHVEEDNDTLLGNSLFADGAAAAIIGGNLRSGETPLWDIVRLHSCGFKDSMSKMSWEASDQGFRMKLCHTVPVIIKRHMQEYAKELLNDITKIDECDWAIHPGGSSIIQAVEKSLHLTNEQTFSSWQVLKDYGNMSSATFLFVLEEISKKRKSRQWTAGVGFGPGLSVEGILMKNRS